MASVFDLLPCGNPTSMVTSVIQTRIFTTTGPLPLDCDNVSPLSDSSSCNVWSEALQQLSVVPCSGVPSTPDIPANISTTSTISVGQSIAGRIDTPDDTDWYKIYLENAIYIQINLDGQDTNSGTVTDPLIEGIYNSLGQKIHPGNDDGPDNLNSQMIFQPSSSSNYFIAVKSLNEDEVGTYRLSVSSPTLEVFDPHLYVGVDADTLVGFEWKRFWFNVNSTWNVRVDIYFDSDVNEEVEAYWCPGSNLGGYPPTEPSISYLPLVDTGYLSVIIPPGQPISRYHFAIRVVSGTSPVSVSINSSIIP